MVGGEIHEHGSWTEERCCHPLIDESRNARSECRWALDDGKEVLLNRWGCRGGEECSLTSDDVMMWFLERRFRWSMQQFVSESNVLSEIDQWFPFRKSVSLVRYVVIEQASQLATLFFRIVHELCKMLMLLYLSTCWESCKNSNWPFHGRYSTLGNILRHRKFAV